MMSNCAFCNRQAFEERIIAETDSFYVIATLGQIIDGGYVLIFINFDSRYDIKKEARLASTLGVIERFKYLRITF